MRTDERRRIACILLIIQYAIDIQLRSSLVCDIVHILDEFLRFVGLLDARLIELNFIFSPFFLLLFGLCLFYFGGP